MTMTPLDIFIGAKQALADKGWTKNTMVDDNGCVCTLGALNVAAFGDPLGGLSDQDADKRAVRTDAVRILESLIPADLLGTYTDERYDSDSDRWVTEELPVDPDVADFNDREETELGDIFALLDLAIDKVTV